VGVVPVRARAKIVFVYREAWDVFVVRDREACT